MNLFQTLGSATLVDCDVEEPNARLILQRDLSKAKDVVIPKPKIDPEKCAMCGDCVSHCRYHALVEMIDTIYLAKDLCHGCGLCTRICPTGAITEEDHVIGTISEDLSDTNGSRIYQGELEIGQSMASPVIRDLLKYIPKNTEFPIILDSPPGTACPVVTTLSESDFVILVTEPNPYSLENLKQSIEVVKLLDKKFGVVLNKSQDKFDNLILDYLLEKNIPLLVKIPFRKEIAEVYAEGHLLIEKFADIRDQFSDLWMKIKERAM